MLSAVDDKLIINALDLRKKIDTALEMGIPAESIGAALMLEKGLDPGDVFPDLADPGGIGDVLGARLEAHVEELFLQLPQIESQLPVLLAPEFVDVHLRRASASPAWS